LCKSQPPKRLTVFTPQFCTSQPPTRLTVFTPQLCTSQPPTRLSSLHSSVHLSLQND
ncbi:hypothetical protein BgiBS90_010216, partial [Biomphalaria glabrata]